MRAALDDFAVAQHEDLVGLANRAEAVRDGNRRAAAHEGFERRLDEALASYDKAISLKPESVEAHHNRGNLLVEMQRTDAREVQERDAGIDARMVKPAQRAELARTIAEVLGRSRPLHGVGGSPAD